MSRRTTIQQDIIPAHIAPHEITLARSSLSQSSTAIALLVDSSHVGIATQTSPDGLLKRLAVASRDTVLVITVDPKCESVLRTRDAVLVNLLQVGPILLGFGMARIALQIQRDLKVHVRNGIDLSTLCSPSTRETWAPSKVVSYRLCSLESSRKVDWLWYGADESSEREVALRAWISALVADPCAADISISTKIDTRNLTVEELAVLGDLVKQADALEANKPRETPNTFAAHRMTSDGGMKLLNAQFKNRVRRSNQTSVIMTDISGREYTGRADGVNGRVTDIKFDGGRSLVGNLAAVRVVGKEEFTNAERARDELILLMLRGELKITDARFVSLLWFPQPTDAQELSPPGSVQPFNVSSFLNVSQNQALERMTSFARPIVIVQGPPGTGKTKTIAAAASAWEARGLPVWIVAQSNVAVKNIAEKLADQGVRFKIIVSKEFYVEWHEDIYGPIEDFLLRTDELTNPDARGLVHLLQDAQIVLSTLSTLSNPGLDQIRIFSLVPLERLVVDEASQINVFDYMHVLYKFRETLEKICFFGDPKQLPPYGTDHAPTLKSIFEVRHLQDLTQFLDTQYRMPVPIGDFISSNVYSRRLSSQHDIKSMDCVKFINVGKGNETASGFSWTNLEEVQAICHLRQSNADLTLRTSRARQCSMSTHFKETRPITC
ncbi:P-loop containing nucleoside triphosphate hydrolase protein [Mycena belliarum]|uniref:P-loop containing nucleoside triphosphate hydrolase protein n=1 Tax=Mycena belliarum TaxID=1033014 RepID=A0AAD6TY72_9AGAR|nr:P-loop containing nucleoside triphosphate hydrolase protein [Mycena belliae]